MSSLLDARPAPIATAEPEPSLAPPSELDQVRFDAACADQRNWQFVAWFAGSVLVLLAAVAGFNAWVDPTGVLGTGIVDPRAAMPRDRAAKVAIVDHVGDPDMVVLGTSRSKRLDPRQLGVPTTRPVNATTVGSDVFESRVLVDWLDKRSRARGAAMPKIVVGVDVEEFRGRSLRSSGLLAVPQLASIARRDAAGDSGWRDWVAQLPDLLFTWSAVRESYSSLRARDALAAEAAARARGNTDLGGGRTRSPSEFDAAGIPRADADWRNPNRQERMMRALPQARAASLAEYTQRYHEMGSKLDPDSVEDLRALVRTVRARGGRPVIVVTPASPDLAARTRSLGREARRAKLLAILRREERSGHITLVDCSTCVPGDARNWLDAVHVSPYGAHIFMAHVRRALAARHAV